MQLAKRADIKTNYLQCVKQQTINYHIPLRLCFLRLQIELQIALITAEETNKFWSSWNKGPDNKFNKYLSLYLRI